MFSRPQHIQRPRSGGAGRFDEPREDAPQVEATIEQVLHLGELAMRVRFVARASRTDSTPLMQQYSVVPAKAGIQHAGMAPGVEDAVRRHLPGFPPSRERRLSGINDLGEQWKLHNALVLFNPAPVT